VASIRRFLALTRAWTRVVLGWGLVEVGQGGLVEEGGEDTMGWMTRLGTNVGYP
jgi:hypothetical protein